MRESVRNVSEHYGMSAPAVLGIDHFQLKFTNDRITQLFPQN